MSNTYAINTTRGKEFVVEAELRALGLQPWVPRILIDKNVKEQPEPIWYDRAYIPKLMFCVFPAVYWRDVVELKHVHGKPMPFAQRDIDGVPAHVKSFKDSEGNLIHVPQVPGLKAFKQVVDAEYADRSRQRDNNEYQCQYKQGQALELLAGSFEGLPATFHDVIKRAHDDYAKLRVNVAAFGGESLMEISPDQVRIAG